MIDLLNYQELPDKFLIKVTPKAKHAYIKNDGIKEGYPAYKIYVTEPAEDGKANQAVIALLAKELNLAKSKINIISGLTSRIKTVKIEKR